MSKKGKKPENFADVLENVFNDGSSMFQRMQSQTGYESPETEMIARIVGNKGAREGQKKDRSHLVHKHDLATLTSY